MTRRQLLDRAEAEGLVLSASHSNATRRESEPTRMRANIYGRLDREVMVSKYSEKLARLYKAQVDLYRLVIEDAETSKIEAAVSRVATLSFELTQMPDIPETVKEWHERIMEKAFPKNAISVHRTPPRGTRSPSRQRPRLTDNHGSGLPGRRASTPPRRAGPPTSRGGRHRPLTEWTG